MGTKHIGRWTAALALAAAAACGDGGTGAAADPCARVRFTPGSTAAGALPAGACRVRTGELVHRYGFTFKAPRAEELLLTTTEIDGVLSVFDSTGQRVGVTPEPNGATDGSSLRFYAPAGRYELWVGASGARTAGAFQLTSRAVTPKRCDQGWVVAPATITGSLATGDCTAKDGSFLNLYHIHLRAGRTITIIQRSTAFDSFLALGLTRARLVDVDDNGGGGLDARIDYTAPFTGDFVIFANSQNAGEAGAYTLTVTVR